MAAAVGGQARGAVDSDAGALLPGGKMLIIEFASERDEARCSGEPLSERCIHHDTLRRTFEPALWREGRV